MWVFKFFYVHRIHKYYVFSFFLILNFLFSMYDEYQQSSLSDQYDMRHHDVSMLSILLSILLSICFYPTIYPLSICYLSYYLPVCLCISFFLSIYDVYLLDLKSSLSDQYYMRHHDLSICIIYHSIYPTISLLSILQFS